MIQKLRGPFLTTLCILLLAACAYFAHDRALWSYFVGSVIASSLALVALWRWYVPPKGVIIVLAILLRIGFSYIPPILSDDAYRYVWDGVLTAQGENPFEYKPSDPVLTEMQDDPIYPLLNSADFYSVYPPVSQLVFAGGGLAYEQGWEASYYVIKALLSLLEIGALLMLATMVSRAFLILYAWNPLVLVETAGQAHTESAMLFFLVACLWFAHRNKPILASSALAFAGWVKLYPFVFFPLLWRRFGWKGLIPGGIVSVLLLAPFYFPEFLSNVFESLNLYVSYFEFNAGLYYALKKVFLIWTGDDWSKQLGPFLRRVFLISLPIIYALDWKFNWSLPKAFLAISVAFLLCSTTIHPWYFLGLLALVTWQQKIAWHWFWLAACSMGTYLLYSDGPYWLFVHLGWWGWGALLLFVYRGKPGEWLQALQRFRATLKVEDIEDLIAPSNRKGAVLDLGAGEGYVGQEIKNKWGAEVTLADVVDINRTDLPHVLYDGQTLPFEDNQFDTTILYFVLHHAEGAERVLDEAKRVTKGQIIIVESVYKTQQDLNVLTFLDVLANRLRSGGLMNAQEEFLHFRTVPEWKKLFEEKGVRVTAEMGKYSKVHQQHFFVLSTIK
ncbi:MAG: class I SAM-dependent methyltransferase [Rhodothermaceae bacterium]|nr:class I SAM-dependent methyltransferase [Rhodothermaceae bacterium]